MTDSTRIALAVLESHAAAYYATDPNHFKKREAIVGYAAKLVEPIIAEIIRREIAKLSLNPT